MATRLFADGQYFTPDRKARLIAPDKPALSEETQRNFRLRLNTGRIRDQWHTMTRSGQSPRLAKHKPEPFVEVHPLMPPHRAPTRAASPACSSLVRRVRAQGRGHRQPAARLVIRADPLERCNCIVGPCRRSGDAGERSVIPDSLKPRRRRWRSGRWRLLIVGFRWRANRRRCRWHMVGAGRGPHGVGYSICEQRRADGTWQARAPICLARSEITEYLDDRAESIAPRPLSRAGSWAACSSERRSAAAMGRGEGVIREQKNWTSSRDVRCCRVNRPKASTDPGPRDLRLLRYRPQCHSGALASGKPQTSRRSESRCVPAPNAAPACRNSGGSLDHECVAQTP